MSSSDISSDDFDKLLDDFPNLETFLNKWNGAMKKQAIIDELYENGINLDVLKEYSGKDNMDDFDLICHIAFDKKPLTRQERANNVKKREYQKNPIYNIPSSILGYN